MLLVGAAFMTPVAAFAQSAVDPDDPPAPALEEEADVEDDAQAPEADAGEDQPTPDRRRPGAQPERRDAAKELRRLLEQFRELREAFYDGIELDEEQDEAAYRSSKSSSNACRKPNTGSAIPTPRRRSRTSNARCAACLS